MSLKFLCPWVSTLRALHDCNHPPPHPIHPPLPATSVNRCILGSLLAVFCQGFCQFFLHMSVHKICKPQPKVVNMDIHFTKHDPFLILVPCINLKKPYDGPGRLKFFTPSPKGCLYLISFKCSTCKYSACRINIYENFQHCIKINITSII